MVLTHSQKKYLKKNLKRKALAQIAQNLNLSEKDLLDYFKSQWPKEKYQKFLDSQSHLPGGVAPAAHLEGETKERRGDTWKVYAKQNWKVFALLAFLVLAVYLTSLGNDFVSDDIPSIKENSLINQLNYFWRAPYFNPLNLNLRQLIIFLTHQIFGPNPLFYRLSNVFFHLGSTWLAYLLIARFFKSPIPLITASIFAVHPILTESVTWISGGPYSNGAFFALLSFFTYLQIKWTGSGPLISLGRAWRPYFISLIFFLSALLFSEKFIIFPLILLLYEICPPASGLRANWRKLIPFWVISGVLIFNLFGLLGTRITSLTTAFYQEPGIENPLIQIPIAVTSYLELIFWPQNLTLYHSEMRFSQLEYFLRLGIFLLFLGGIIWSFKKHRQIFFWLVFFIITLLPTLTPLRISWIVAERYAYLGSLGIFAVAALLIQKVGQILKNQRAAYVILAFILVALSTRTIARNLNWKNQDTLWLATAKTSPSSAQNHNNLGDYYARQGNLEKAAEEFKKAIELNPRYGDAYHNLANTYGQMGKLDQALENYQAALSFNPNLWQSYQNLGAIYFSQEKFNLAQEFLQKAITIVPQNPNLHANLGVVYLKIGEKEKAREEFLKALQLDPNHQGARAGLAEATK